MAGVYYSDIDRESRMIMKYHVSVDCQELHFSSVLHASGKYYHEGKYNYLGTTDVIFHPFWSISGILDGSNEQFYQNLMVLYDYHKVW